MRETVGSSGSSLTVRDSMLKPRPENSPATRASTPNSFSTRTDIVWLVMLWSARAHGPEPMASASLLLITAENRHHAIFRGQLKLLDALFFYFLFVGQVMFISKDFEFLFERLMLRVEGPQLLVVGQMLPNEFFLSMLHTPSVPMPAGFFEVGLNVASGVLIYSGSSEAARSVSPRANRAPPSAATQTPRKSSIPVSKTATLWPRDSTRAAASFALWSPTNMTSSAMRDARCSSATTDSSDSFSSPSATTR